MTPTQRNALAGALAAYITAAAATALVVLLLPVPAEFANWRVGEVALSFASWAVLALALIDRGLQSWCRTEFTLRLRLIGGTSSLGLLTVVLLIPLDLNLLSASSVLRGIVLVVIAQILGFCCTGLIALILEARKTKRRQLADR